jgi:hypothetical protein
MAYLDRPAFKIFGNVIIISRCLAKHIEQIGLVNSGGEVPSVLRRLAIVRCRVHNDETGDARLTILAHIQRRDYRWPCLASSCLRVTAGVAPARASCS